MQREKNLKNGLRVSKQGVAKVNMVQKVVKNIKALSMGMNMVMRIEKSTIKAALIATVAAMLVAGSLTTSSAEDLHTVLRKSGWTE